MRYAILADVHANLEALRAVLDDARERADALLCLGDVVAKIVLAGLPRLLADRQAEGR